MRLLRTRKRYGISARVLIGGEVEVKAGYAVTDREIDNFLLSHERWLRTHIRAQKERAEYKAKYLSGETILLHGIDYPVRYIAGKGASQFDGEEVVIYTTGDKKTALDKWFREYATNYLNGIWERLAGDVCPMHVRQVKTYYGICYKRAKGSYINLNASIVHADDDCIRYVIYHEITHLEVPNHSAEFYRRLALLEPRHRELRARLKDTVKVAE